MIALDTNILIYTVSDEDVERRRERSLALIRRIEPSGAIVPLQVIGEFLNACRRKKILLNQVALQRAHEFLEAFDCYPTQIDDLLEAMQLSSQVNLQYFDALIITVSKRAGATVLLSEDMHDGLVIDGLQIVNPFVAKNGEVIAAALV